MAACRASTLMFSYASVKRSLNGMELVPRKYNSVSTINRVKSAVVFLHREAKVAVSTELNAMMKEYVSDYRRKFAQLKESGEAPITEEKSPLPFGGYSYLASVAVATEYDYSWYVTAHSFLLLYWNLMARVVSTSSIRYEQITWKSCTIPFNILFIWLLHDALRISFGLMKNDQEGRMSYPRHVYTYPSHPAICPNLSLGVLLLTRGAQVPESPTLLFGYNAKERFSAWLAKTCAANADDIAGLGLSISDIVMVWLRACWSLGGVQGRYIFEGSGGDQFEGRAATGLNVNDVEFGALPPHFGQSVSLSPAQKELILPVYSSFYPATFRSTVPYLLASLVHHHAWLKSTLHHSHPLFLYHVWLSGSLPALLAGLHGGTLYNPIANMMATEMSYHTVYDTISNQ
ncbi:hypothetical protein, variant 1 [Aphanomyces astaci]|uniref:Uncharacterized protein n=1 Tax=Aphanomyces astaci TaxID=112090 RepID=W4FGV3_APHAT|nr:hypothetical protein, variant 1 [Aphanomyces astaci]ETV66757.1 hypothetical protein, variant 1 [Aphanomyces astaci]|eukprot:XP_009843735.1 hypothetical protein, variant 1 [Aphanomyces astaci]